MTLTVFVLPPRMEGITEGIDDPDHEGRSQIVREQGTQTGRQSFAYIAISSVSEGEDGNERELIEVGGATVPVLEGTLRLG